MRGGGCGPPPLHLDALIAPRLPAHNPALHAAVCQGAAADYLRGGGQRCARPAGMVASNVLRGDTRCVTWVRHLLLPAMCPAADCVDARRLAASLACCSEVLPERRLLHLRFQPVMRCLVALVPPFSRALLGNLQADKDWQAIATGADTALLDVREPAELDRASAARLATCVASVPQVLLRIE